jgi:hypothetical protein
MLAVDRITRLATVDADDRHRALAVDVDCYDATSARSRIAATSADAGKVPKA